jgi:hypothetical protein
VRGLSGQDGCPHGIIIVLPIMHITEQVQKLLKKSKEAVLYLANTF